MKTITIEGHEFEIRGLTRGEVRRLQAGKFNLEDACDVENPEKMWEAQDKILGMAVISGPPLDEITPGGIMELASEAGRLTWISPAVLKNLNAPQENGSPEGSAPAASAGKKGSKRKGGARK